MRKLTAIMCAILVFTTTTIPVYAEDEIYIEPGQKVSENMESEKMESEKMESENTESVDESEDAGESDETGEPADEYGAAPLAEETHEVSYGPFTLKASEEIIQNTDYNTNTSDTLTITSSKPVTISMAASSSITTQYKIAVESPDGANITLSGVSIKSSSGIAFEIKASSGPVTVTLDGDNTLQSGSSYAGLQKGNNAQLTINGSGSLKATGGTGGGAGIGGGVSGSGSYITIESGTIEATGGNNGGAGIGGGYLGSGTDIKINGGNITAQGGTSGGAGIGGGSSGSGTGITISGGTVEATGGAYGSAGIGGGVGGSGTDITINSGTEIIANGGQGGSGIGGGQSGSGTRITINGGKIKAIGGSTYSVGGAGIGGGSSGSGENITISGGIVTANGGVNGAGIGGGGTNVANGRGGNGTSITISGGTVEAKGGGNGAGIGGGGGNGFSESVAGNGDQIIITGSGTVQATGAGNGAGIGGGGNGGAYAGNGTNITINLNGGEVIAKASTSGCGAGIGGGAQNNSTGTSGYSESISISGSGTVEAKGGTSNYMTGAAIGGGGNGGNSKGITISGSVTVKAESGYIGCGTGWGVNGNSGAITIDEYFSGTINAGTIGGGGENSSVTIKGGGTITATETIGGSGSTVNIKGENEDFYPWVEAARITRTNTDEYNKCVVFDKNYKNNYGNEITDETTKKIRQEHSPDGVVYGDVSLAERDEAYVLESGKTLTIHTGGKLTTGDKFTLESGAVVYLENGATLVKYEDINGYQDEGNTSQVLHEADSKTTDEKTCDICGANIPHHWKDEWVNTNTTHHWHECIGKDCSVYGRNQPCTITDNSQKAGYGRHIFREEETSWGGVKYVCEVCGYYSWTEPVTPDPIEIYKVDGESKALAGAIFGLYSDENCNDDTVDEATSVEVNIAGETKAVASFVGDKIELDTTYYIREIKAPTGYTKSDDKYKVTVDSNGKVTYGESDTTPSTCMNTKIVIDPIKIYKEDGNGNALAGATFGLYSDENCNDDDKVYEATSAEVKVDGKTKAVASFAGDKIEPDKTYYIREIKAPTGYKKSDDKYEVTVGPDGQVTYSIVDREGKIAALKGIPECVNTKIIPDPVKIILEDGETGAPLAGAEFGIYSDKQCTEANRIAVGTTKIDTDSASDTYNKAVVSFKTELGRAYCIIELDKTYYIKETKAPEGYTASEEVYKAVVGADGKVTYGVVGSETTSETVPVCKNYAVKITYNPPSIKKVDEKTGVPLVLSPKTGDAGEVGAAGIVILSGIACVAFLVGVIQKRKRKKELL